MPKIDPFSYLITAIGNMTGGLVSDMQSAILGVLLLGFIAMGGHILFDILGDSLARRRGDSYFLKADAALKSRDSFARGTADYDYYNAIYRRYLNKSVDSRFN